MFEDDDSVFAAMRAGARGYMLKGAGAGDIARAIRAVGSGEAIFGPDVARRVMDFFTTPRPELSAMAFPELTDREREVLELIAQGRNNAWIAAALRAQPEDHPQPRLEHLHEAAGGRPRRGDRAGARGRARPGRQGVTAGRCAPIELTWLGGPEVEQLALADDEIVDAVEAGAARAGPRADDDRAARPPRARPGAARALQRAARLRRAARAGRRQDRRRLPRQLHARAAVRAGRCSASSTRRRARRGR